MAQILLFGLAGWLPNSPDLNLIEMVWGMMKWRAKKAAPKTKEALMETIRTVWEELDQEMLNRMVTGSERRLVMVIKVRGRSISAHLSSHQSEPTAEDAAENQDCHPFSTEEDAAILTWVNLVGNRWKRTSKIMAPRFELRERVVTNHRAEMLMGNQVNLALMARTAITPEEEEEEASVQLGEAMIQLGESFQSPPFPVE
jgi:hypothetical protein